MTSGAAPSTATGDLLAEVEARIAASRSVHRRVPGLGYLHLERPLPFLVVGSERLVSALPAHLLLDEAASRKKIETAVSRIAAGLAARRGAALVIRIEVSEPGAPASGPSFRIATPAEGALAATLSAFEAALGRVEIDGRAARVSRAPAPGRPERQRHPNVYELWLEVAPIYRSDDGVATYPLVLSELRGQLERALREGCVAFAREFGASPPPDPAAFARQRLLKTARDVDRRLTGVSSALRYLYFVTPTNTEPAFRDFAASGYEQAPRFEYRPLDFDPQLLKREIYAIPLERVEDPTLIAIFREKQLELDRLVTLLVDRNSERFRAGSLQLFGGVGARLHGIARQILERTDACWADEEAGQQISAEAFAELARREVEHYRAAWPELAPQIVLSDDVPGLMVVNGALVIGKNVGLTPGRARALIEHEIGTHLVTFYNGGAQRLHHLGSGLAGYEALQEGLAVLAEYLVGGLSAGRMRLIAARVMAVASMTDGASFVDTWKLLSHEIGLSPRTAFTVAMRVHRGGGLSKDAIYLRGLEQVLGYLAGGGELDDLLVGKVSLEQLPLVRELRLRGVIRPPRLRPRWSTDPDALRRLASLSRAQNVLELLKEDPCVSPSS